MDRSNCLTCLTPALCSSCYGKECLHSCRQVAVYGQQSFSVKRIISAYFTGVVCNSLCENHCADIHHHKEQHKEPKQRAQRGKDHGNHNPQLRQKAEHLDNPGDLNQSQGADHAPSIDCLPQFDAILRQLHSQLQYAKNNKYAVHQEPSSHIGLQMHMERLHNETETQFEDVECRANVPHGINDVISHTRSVPVVGIHLNLDANENSVEQDHKCDKCGKCVAPHKMLQAGRLRFILWCFGCTLNHLMTEVREFR
mmetsp:Transcript_237/g.356  ORF Transcript_237/g.356 Transcript_237/m.356 type:complete len:254 (-) Transcript_237:259-1020(-)